MPADDNPLGRFAIRLPPFHFPLSPPTSYPAPPRMIALTIENLTKRFGEVVALDRIDLRIGAGEIFFLLGPSGCGKTTLLRSVAGFYIPEEGRILFGEEDVTRLPPHLRNTDRKSVV